MHDFCDYTNSSPLLPSNNEPPLYDNIIYGYVVRDQFERVQILLVVIEINQVSASISYTRKSLSNAEVTTNSELLRSRREI